VPGLLEPIYEQRSQLPPELVVPAIQVTLWVTKKLAGETLDAVLAEIRAAVVRRIRGRILSGPQEGERRRVVILDQYGDPLLEVDVPDEAEGDEPAEAEGE
jgi:hypothetical protein